MKAKTDEQLQPFDWSSAEGTGHYEGILFSVRGDQHVVKAGEVFVRRNTRDATEAVARALGHRHDKPEPHGRSLSPTPCPHLGVARDRCRFL